MKPALGSGMTQLVLEPLSTYCGYSSDEMITRAQAFYEDIRRRRTARDFCDKPVSYFGMWVMTV